MSHYESFDPKPEAPVDIRGEFKSINTATPGIQFSEHIPLLAKHSNKLAIVRSVHHNNGAHSGAVYLNLITPKQILPYQKLVISSKGKIKLTLLIL